ncbi:unnamed protein product [Caenorhabditis auriculariae]|uniref:Glycosyltransferase family 92 protein n=1 Tax=Caenorhabditis auriculariae TaxID=2777116 RepID=A0A8S1GPV3_9PELO|nr:unnamed protein product [Caenorhabditis auriculariae]
MAMIFVLQEDSGSGKDTSKVINTLRAKREADENDLSEVDTPKTSFPGIYVRDVYRVSDDSLRIIYLEEKDNTKNLKVKIGSVWQTVDSFCFNSTCMDYLFCSMATRIGTVHLPPATSQISTIPITSEDSEEFVMVPVIDVRTTNSKVKHKLGVCLQPIFFFTDWTIVIQTKKVLDFYKEKLGDDLELVNWSDLPVHARDRGNYQKDPNSRVFRYAATAFMHDCLLRSRSHVKFVANTDLDDLPVASNFDIVEQLEKNAAQYPNAAQFVTDWILSSQKVVHFDMHSVYRNEISPITKTPFTTINLENDADLFFLHLRRFERHLIIPTKAQNNETFPYQILSKLNQIMSDQYAKRAAGDSFSEVFMAPWASEARETMRNLEQCRLEAFGTQLSDVNEMCQQSSAGSVVFFFKELSEF